MFEFQTIIGMQKPMVFCMMEPGFWNIRENSDGTLVVSRDSDLWRLSSSKLCADFEEALCVYWDAEDLAFQDRP